MNSVSVIDDEAVIGLIREEEATAYSCMDLIPRIARKDKAAFNELYHGFSQVVFNLGFRVLRDRGEAEEIVQEVFFQVWDKASSYDPNRGAVTTWIMNITRSRAIDRLRTLGFRKLNTEMDVERINPKSDFIRITEGDKEKRTIIQKALDNLPEEQRLAVEMAYFDGFTHYEIAERLNKPVGTIKTRITLGVARLRKQLIHYFPELR
ncbi:MAG: sigma-70 family RNA polymerase sigma factor [Thermodesulfobacteriota bacterium]